MNEVYQGETSKALNYFTNTLKMESKSKVNPDDAFMHFIIEQNSKIEKMISSQEHRSQKYNNDNQNNESTSLLI